MFGCIHGYCASLLCCCSCCLLLLSGLRSHSSTSNLFSLSMHKWFAQQVTAIITSMWRFVCKILFHKMNANFFFEPRKLFTVKRSTCHPSRGGSVWPYADLCSAKSDAFRFQISWSNWPVLTNGKPLQVKLNFLLGLGLCFIGTEEPQRWEAMQSSINSLRRWCGRLVRVPGYKSLYPEFKFCLEQQLWFVSDSP